MTIAYTKCTRLATNIHHCMCHHHCAHRTQLTVKMLSVAHFLRLSHRVIVTETDRMAVSQPLDASARDSSVIPGRHNDPLADDLARHASAVPAHATFPTLAIGTGTKFSDDLFERPVVPNAASTKLFKVKPKRDCLPAEDPISKGILTEDQAVNYFNL